MDKQITDSKYYIILIIIISVVMFIIGYRLGESRHDMGSDNNKLFSLNITIILSILAGIVWTAGSTENLLFYPLSCLFIGIAYGILLSCVSGCIYKVLPYELKPILPILLFCSIIYSLICY